MLSTDIQKLKKSFPDYIAAVEKHYRWNFAVIALDASFFAFSVAMLSQDTIIPYFVSHLSAHPAFIGLVPAIYYLGYFFPQLLGAFLVNGRPTRKWAIFWIAVTERIGILAIAVVAQLTGIISNNLALGVLMMSYLVFSVTNGLIGPAYGDFISKNIIRNRGFFYGVMNGLGGVLGLTASLVATRLLGSYDFPSNLRYLFWIGFATSFISPFFIASFRETPFPIESKTEDLKTFLKNIPGHIRASVGFKRFLIVRGLMGFGIMGNAFFALYAIDRFGLSSGAVGTFTMIILLTQMLFGFIWGWLGDRFGFKIVYVVESGLFILTGVLAMTAIAPWAFYLIAVCMGGVYAAFRVADPNMVFELASPEQTSRFIGISNTFVAPILTVAPLVGSLIVDGLSHQALFIAVLVVGLLSLWLCLRYLPNTRREAAAAK
ncbi:MAG: MFS transporter [Anaerolineales bacterium]|nr:MFS transporter [Anaerolineales bacterium]